MTTPTRRQFLLGTVSALGLAGTAPAGGQLRPGPPLPPAVPDRRPAAARHVGPQADAPAEIRGELKPIATAVPGLHFTELFPHLARRADRLCVVRSVTHGDTVHTSAGYTMLTGVPHPKANVDRRLDGRPRPDDHPHLGSLLAFARPPATGPAFASLPEIIKDAAVNEFPGQRPGSSAGGSTRSGSRPTRSGPGFLTPDVFPPADVPAAGSTAASACSAGSTAGSSDCRRPRSRAGRERPEGVRP